MAIFNQVTFAGNMGKDPEMNYTPNGKPVTKFSLAVSDYAGKDAQGSALYTTMWLTIVCWGDLAERVNSNLHKGLSVLVSGRLVIRDYTAKDGTKGRAIEVVANTVSSLEKTSKATTASGYIPNDDNDPLGDLEEHPF